MKRRTMQIDDPLRAISGAALWVASAFFALNAEAQTSTLQLSGTFSATTVPASSTAIPASAPFYVKASANKCIDAGTPETRYAGQALSLNDCNQTVAQRIDIVEVAPERHEVILKASDYCFGPRGAERKVGALLELQICQNASMDQNASMEQRFAIDGDSIINLAPAPPNSLILDRLVIEPEHGRTVNGTALVLGERHLDDLEFWTFTPAFALSQHTFFDASAAQSRVATSVLLDNFRWKPTSGFVTVTNEADLRRQFAPDPSAPGSPRPRPGTVIELASDFKLTALADPSTESLIVPDGVTIRGGRRGTQLGFEISYPSDFSITDPLFKVQGDNVRITGLHIRGPSTDRNPDHPGVSGILIKEDPLDANAAARTIVDHNEISGFTEAAIRVEGPHGYDPPSNAFCLGPRDYRLRQPKVLVTHNYLHHNQRQGGGYGVEIAAGAHVRIEGNTFDSDRHAITATYDARNEYYAYANLVMPDAPEQNIASWLSVAKHFAEAFWNPLLVLVPETWHTQDFDVHGSGPGETIDFEDGLVPPFAGGYAGKYFDIAGNTFLGDNRETLDLRGTPCLGAAYHDNVTRRSHDDAITDRSEGNILRQWGNQFGIKDPMQTLGSGDFDGDGQPDRFMATGAAWYYQPAGRLEWRFLQSNPLTLDQIELRDVDGDGRTDAVYRRGNQIYASWGASSPGDQIGEIPVPPQTYHPPDPRTPLHGQRP